MKKVAVLMIASCVVAGGALLECAGVSSEVARFVAFVAVVYFIKR